MKTEWVILDYDNEPLGEYMCKKSGWTMNGRMMVLDPEERWSKAIIQMLRHAGVAV